MTLTSSPQLVWHFWVTSPKLYSPKSSLTLHASGQWGGGGGNYLLSGTPAVKLPRVLADTVFSGKSFQSLMVFARDEDCLYWVWHWISESRCEWSLLWRPAARISSHWSQNSCVLWRRLIKKKGRSSILLFLAFQYLKYGQTSPWWANKKAGIKFKPQQSYHDPNISP